MGGSQSRGARANDRDVIDLLRIYRPQQADTARELVLAGVTQQLAVRTQNNGPMDASASAAARVVWRIVTATSHDYRRILAFESNYSLPRKAPSR